MAELLSETEIDALVAMVADGLGYRVAVRLEKVLRPGALAPGNVVTFPPERIVRRIARHHPRRWSRRWKGLALVR